MRPRRHTIPAVLVALLTSCTAGADSPGPVEVSGTSFAYDPVEIHAATGTTVEVVFTVEDAPHDLVFDGHDLRLEGDAGDRVTGLLRIGEPGTFAFYCTLPGHRAAGMEGTLLVE